MCIWRVSVGFHKNQENHQFHIHSKRYLLQIIEWKDTVLWVFWAKFEKMYQGILR